ncbi:MAG: hypothetical protein NVSMB48_15840 [Marmoricola sp.]
MPRPKNSPYTLGTVTTRSHPTRPGWFAARGYFKSGNGKRVEVTAAGKTEAAAKRALQRKVDAARNTYQGGDKQLNQDTTVNKASAVWLDWKARQRTNGRPLATSTLNAYRGYVRRYVANHELVAHLSLTEVNDIGRIEAWLADLADNYGESAAVQARTMLRGILELAERRKAIPASVIDRAHTPGPTTGSRGDRKCKDADCDGDCGKRHLDTERAFTFEEALRVQKAADASRADISDLTAFLFGTGVRISEALHCVDWADVDLANRIVRVRGTKSPRADRILKMSDELTERLQARAELHGTDGLVFGTTRFTTKIGRPRERNNVLKALRCVLTKAGTTWAGSHTFRRTVASWMDEAGAGLAEIANQLGHADTNVTAGYLGRTTQPSRAAEIMVLSRRPTLRVVSGE